MTFTLRGNGVAIALGALAVVVAATGTAVAVTATQTTIVDPAVATRAAHVDVNGRLTTAGYTATLDASIYAPLGSTGSRDTFVSSPTAATLAVTRIMASALPANTANYYVELLQVPVTTEGDCSITGVSRTLGVSTIRPGDSQEQQYDAPLIVKPTSAGQKYCLDVYYSPAGATGSGEDTAYTQFSGYVVSGHYTGLGTSATSTSAPAMLLPGKRVTK